MAAGTSSSYADRIARQYEQQFGRPADANDPVYAEYVKTALPQMIAEDRAALARSQGRWRTMDKIAMGTTLGLLGAGVGSAIGAGGAASGSAGSASVPGAVGAEAAPLGMGSVSAGALPSGIGLSNAAVGTGTAAGAAAGGGAARRLVGGLTGSQLAQLGLTGASAIGSAFSDPPDMRPTTATSDPNLMKLIQSMQGRIDKSEPLYDSILSMANGLLPTQYQKGGGGRT